METNKGISSELRGLAKKFELSIKESISKKFSVSLDDLSILFDDEEGIYLSKEEPLTLCCLVVGKGSGFLYVVVAKIDEDGLTLSDFRADIVS